MRALCISMCTNHSNVSGNSTEERHRALLRELAYEPSLVCLMGSEPLLNIIPPKYTCTDRKGSLFTDQIATSMSQEFYNWTLPIFCPPLIWNKWRRGWSCMRLFSLAVLFWQHHGLMCSQMMQIVFEPTALSRKRQKKNPFANTITLQAGAWYLCNSVHCPHSDTWQNIETDVAKICKTHTWSLWL